jgi:hypothetical protein
MRHFKTFAVFVLLIGWLPLTAQISEKINIHGFGGWGYGNTDGAPYLYGDENGAFDHSQFYLNINANPLEKLAIIAQIGASQGEAGQTFEFDYAFAEWKFSDLLRLRIGKVKHAFGIFGEVLNVGTLRPFMTLPQGIYGSQGFVGRGLNGVGLTGSHYSSGGWGIAYDIYFGQLKTVAKLPAILGFVLTQNPDALFDGMIYWDKDIVDLIGGRISISTPLNGLSLGLSGYTGKDKEVDIGTTGMTGAGGFSGDQSSYGVHLEYLSTNLWLRCEYMHHVQNADTGAGQTLETLTNCFYFEAAYKFLDHWQVAVRYDWSEGDITELDMNIMPRFFQEYMKHQDLALGLNYWFNHNLVVKLAYHMKEGLQFAWPSFDDPFAFLQGQFENKTNLIQFGVHFSF